MIKTLHILNPAAGSGHLPDTRTLDGEVHITTRPGDATEFLEARLFGGGYYRVFGYGGDGTQNEAVNGIMRAGAGKRTVLTPVPTGTGNDFFKLSSKMEEETACDVIRYNDRYALNVLNIGFDSAVAERTNNLKKSRFSPFHGASAYIVSCGIELVKKTTEHLKLSLYDEANKRENIEDDFLLCLVANGRYYGGGFEAAPAAEPSDGLLDVIMVKNVSRMTFIKLVGLYKRGEHIDKKTLRPTDKLRDILTFRRVPKLTIDNVHRFCTDGEISTANGSLNIESISHAILVCGAGGQINTESHKGRGQGKSKLRV